MSRRHATLHLGDEIVVEGLGSANGTRVITTAVDAQMTAQTLGTSVCHRTPGWHSRRPRRFTWASVALLVRPLGQRREPVRAPGDRPGGAIVASPAMKRVVELSSASRSRRSVCCSWARPASARTSSRARIHCGLAAKAGPTPRSTARRLPSTCRERAVRAREGRVHRRAVNEARALEAPTNGTAFLDEIGELPLSAAGEAPSRARGRRGRARRRLKPRPIDVRFVAATNRDLKADSRSGDVPSRSLFPAERNDARDPTAPRAARGRPSARAPLRGERRHDAEARAPGARPRDTHRSLHRYPFPGNIRELRNIIERAVALRAAA